MSITPCQRLLARIRIGLSVTSVSCVRAGDRKEKSLSPRDWAWAWKARHRENGGRWGDIAMRREGYGQRSCLPNRLLKCKFEAMNGKYTKRP
jgi:hypothetical protein